MINNKLEGEIYHLLYCMLNLSGCSASEKGCHISEMRWGVKQWFLIGP